MLYVYRFILYMQLMRFPYYAIAANLTADNDERTKLRSVVVVVETIGSLILGIVPPSLIDFFQTHGYSKNTTWMYTAIILGATASIFIFVCWFATKGKELTLSEDEMEEQEEKMNPKEIIDVLKLKPFLLVAAAAFSFYFYYTMLGNTSYYFMTGNLGLSGTQISFVNAYSIVFNMVTVMICGKIAEKFDKKLVFVFALALSAASYTFFGIFGMKTLTSYVIFCTFDGIQNGAYWTIIYTFLYDIVELDEFKTGKRKEGTVMGFFSLITVAGQAVSWTNNRNIITELWIQCRCSYTNRKSNAWYITAYNYISSNSNCYISFLYIHLSY